MSLTEHEYTSGLEARRVGRDASFKGTGGFVFVREAVAHKIVGLRQIDDRRGAST